MECERGENTAAPVSFCSVVRGKLCPMSCFPATKIVIKYEIPTINAVFFRYYFIISSEMTTFASSF